MGVSVVVSMGVSVVVSMSVSMFMSMGVSVVVSMSVSMSQPDLEKSTATDYSAAFQQSRTDERTWCFR